MLKDKNDLYKYIESLSWNIIVNNKEFMSICELCYKKYNLPISKTADIINLKMPNEALNAFELFCVLDCICEVQGKTSKLNKFFTDDEIKYYSTQKYDDNKIEFPLTFKVVQVNHDQWIGKITVKELMAMKDAQLINYNKNTQRTMKMVVKGENEYWRPSLNAIAVRLIKEAFKKKRYIPNTITLNIADDSNADYEYDNDKCELIIHSISHFDITDGFHRYIAMSALTNEIEEFDYPMELRISAFDEYKAKNFIFQEDQKTKMKKSTSNSFNMNSAANIVVDKMNESPMSNLQGLIVRDGSVIDYGTFANIINYFYFKNDKEENRAKILNISKELIDNFNILTEYDEKYLAKGTYNFVSLLTIIVLFSRFEPDKSELGTIVDNAIIAVNNSKNRTLRKKVITKPVVNEIERCIAESMKGSE